MSNYSFERIYEVESNLRDPNLTKRDSQVSSYANFVSRNKYHDRKRWIRASWFRTYYLLRGYNDVKTNTKYYFKLLYDSNIESYE